MHPSLSLPFIFLLIILQTCIGQGVSVNSVGVTSEKRMDDNTLIHNQETGDRITMKEYVRLSRENSKLYHLMNMLNRALISFANERRRNLPKIG